ncbi:hypothetical protein DL770_006510 [Monosporascus sp. CRB-9-2]|nr:hypothetical protein DL770_006510 [Monosporascus sp. CRB-9-2]
MRFASYLRETTDRQAYRAHPMALHIQYLAIAVADILRVHERKVAKICRITASVRESFQCQHQNISSELRNHVQTTQKLLDFSEDVRSMYDDILKLRGQELLHENGLGLARIAQANSTETKLIVSLADQTAQDSRIMRIMTLIAMIYLPANLVLILIV